MKKNVGFLSIIMTALCLAGSVMPACQVYATEVSDETEVTGETEEEAAAEDVTDEEVDVTDDRVIPEGITIQGMDVAGKTVSEADELVDEYFSVYDDVKFSLSANDQTVEATGADLAICAKNSDVTSKAATYGSYGNLVERFKANADLEAGRTKDFAISVGADVSDLIEYLDTVADQVNDDASDNYVTRENGKFVFHEGTAGVVVNVSESAAALVDYIENDWDGSDCSFELTTELKEPEGTEEELSQMTDVLGTFSTDYSSSSANRKNNVANGVAHLNGTVLYPGQTLSVLDKITPFTAENGYELAGSYENGTTVETYGGGICQVSTTLYGAVREAELEVVTRSCHSMIVNYVKPSMDAAISESGGKDFQIKNNKDYPIYIEGTCDGSNAYFTIYGKEDRASTHKVEYESEITGVNVQNTSWVADPNVPLGKMTTTVSGHTGYTARLWKIVYENGEEVSRTVYNNSHYNASNRTVTVGIASEDANLSAQMLQAVATQDGNQIAYAISVLAPGVSNSTPITITPKYSVTNPTTSTDSTTTDSSTTTTTPATGTTDAGTDTSAGTADTSTTTTTPATDTGAAAAETTPAQ